jgi:Polysaccharide lyase
MASPFTDARRVVAVLLAALVVTVAVAAPASGETTLLTKTFKPVDRTRHRLVFEPRSIPAAAIREAQVWLRTRGGRARLRPVPVGRVRTAVERHSSLRVKRPRDGSGRLKVEIGGTTTPSVWRRSASFESTLREGTDGWRADSPFVLERTSEVGGADGSYAAKIVTNGGSEGCSCPRMKFEDGFSYRAGREVWISGSWYIRNPSHLSWSRLMNLGHFEASGDPDNYLVGLVVREKGQMSVRARHYQTEEGQSVLMANRPIPAGRWFTVMIHLKLSPTDGQALTEVYLDGALVASSTARNMMQAGPLHFFNAGLPYFYPGPDPTVYLDAPRLSD